MVRNLRAGAILLLLTAAPAPVLAQHTVRALVVDAHDGGAIPGVHVVVDGTSVAGITDAEGRIELQRLPAGQYVVRFSFVGFRTESRSIAVPGTDSLLVVALEEDEMELAGAMVTATRSTRTIADTPTRVEVIGGEEIEEKIFMDPSGISMLLSESPGIVVQQTSTVSAGATFRIQGLDGRYTQLLRDGFPLYGGLEGGLSLLQVPPLDLAQVEIIKGPASTLYGGDAIAGLVNLVSKQPNPAGERSVLVNATSAGGLDGALYLAGRSERLGWTLLASGNMQQPYDPESDRFTNLPWTRRLSLAPTLLRYGRGTLKVRLSGMVERRRGGDVDAVRGDAPGVTERNASERVTAAVGYERPVGRSTRVTLKTSGSLFRRALEVPDFRFEGRQVASYSEASLAFRRGSHDVVLGMDLRTDRFVQGAGGEPPLDHSHASVGLFAQDTWDVSPVVSLEAGLRVDRRSRFGLIALPRAAVLVRPGSGFTARVGGGLGYKEPTPFLEEAESRAYLGVAPVPDDVEDERSQGLGVDLNYRASVGRLAVALNQAAYVTRLERPLVAMADGQLLAFESAEGQLLARGTETTARLSLGDLSLFLGYVYVDVTRETDGESVQLPLTARHRTYTVLVWERHGESRVGFEAYYTGPQRLPGGGESPGFVVTGIMAQKRFGTVRVFANLENLLDTRQSRTSPLVTGPRTSPVYEPVWGPTDGFVANAGFILDL